MAFAQNSGLLRESHVDLTPMLDLALELSGAVQIPELVRRCTEGAANLLSARAGFMALSRGGHLRATAVYGVDPAITRSLELLLHNTTDRGATAPIAEFVAARGYLSSPLLEQLGWNELLLIRLYGSADDLAAVLCLVDCPRDDETLAKAELIGRQASAALENARLYGRITHSSRQWAEIFDAIGDFLLVHDEEQHIVRVNRAVADSHGRHPSDLVGLPVSEVFAEPDATAPCPFCLNFRYASEYRDPRTSRMYLVSSSRMGGAQEDGHHTVHVLKDVTESRRVERLYRELFDNIQEGAFFSTPDGRFVEVNDAMVRMLGYDSREELLSVDITAEVYAKPGARAWVKRALDESGKLLNHEAALRRKDGTLIHVLENAFVVRDLNGEVVQYRGVLLDITEIKRVQSQLEREHEFNAQILNNTQSLIAVVDTAGLVSYANPKCEQLARSSVGELVGQRLEQLVSASHHKMLFNSFELALAGKDVNNLELPLVRGRELIGRYSVNFSPMRNDAGDVSSVVAVMTDITDVAILQAKLMHTEKMVAIGQLVSGVAHEVNNPLTAILGFADLMLSNPEMPESVRPELEVIVHEAQRTKEIVQNLLSFARQTRPNRDAVDISVVLRRTLALRAYDFSNRGIVLEERIPLPIPEVHGDAHQLQQVFLNILNNAYDAVSVLSRPGRVLVEVAATGGHVEVRMSDNGTGVINIDRIFDPFFTTKEVGKGTGLGLSICYGIVREHGGDITCLNHPDGEGATFCVRLPIAERKSATGAGA